MKAVYSLQVTHTSHTSRLHMLVTPANKTLRIKATIHVSHICRYPMQLAHAGDRLCMQVISYKCRCWQRFWALKLH